MIKVADYEYTPVYYIGESIQTLQYFMQTLDVPKEVFHYTGTTSHLHGVHSAILIIGHGGIEKIRRNPEIGALVERAIGTKRVTAMLEQDYRDLVGS